MIGQYAHQALSSTDRPTCNDDPFACFAQTQNVAAQCIKQISVGLLAFRGEAPPLFNAQIVNFNTFGPIRDSKRRKGPQRSVRNEGFPLSLIKIEKLWFKRFISRRIHRLHFPCRNTCLIIILDEIQPRIQGAFDVVVKTHSTIWKVIKNTVHLLIEQRQPMFHAVIFPALFHCFIKRIIISVGAKGFYIPSAEPVDARLIHVNLTHSHKFDFTQLTDRALALRIKTTDRIKRVPKHV